MCFRLECKKIKRTGFLPALLGGGILAGAVPILHMAFRAQQYLGLPGSPVKILLDASWQLMAMLNLLLVTVLACLLYNNEYADGALRNLRTLPVAEHSIFLGKFLLLAAGCLLIVVIEGASIAFCCLLWFPTSQKLPLMEASASPMLEETTMVSVLPKNTLAPELLKSFGFALLLLLPAALSALVIASLFENMWVSLGSCVLGVFVATMIPAQPFVLSLFPFALAFLTLPGASEPGALHYAAGAVAECLLLLGAELILLKIRRSHS